MIMITAMIQPFRLEHVRRELLANDIAGLTACECAGHGRQPRIVPSRRGGPDLKDVLPKVEIMVAVPSHRRDDAIAAIVRGARLGNIGDGKIFVSRLDKVVSIRTGFENDDALAGPYRMADAAE
jgi:nitrogen regulatory protein P-II 1